MNVTNLTNQDYWFGPIHLAAGATITVDDTSDTSLYLTDDAVADALNNLYAAGNISVSSAAGPFPRPTGTPQVLHGSGSPEGIVFAPQGSLYLRRDNSGAPTALYAKTTAVTVDTGWQSLSSAVPSAAGWTAFSTTLTYSSADGHTFVCTTSTDLTGVIPRGARIQLTHASATKYFIVTAVASGSITLYGGVNYSLSSGTISATSYSVAKAPLGFPLDPTAWMEELSDTSDRVQTNPTVSTWYNTGSLSLAVPIGAWWLEYHAVVFAQPATGSVCDIYATLSTANNSESDAQFTTRSEMQATGSTGADLHASVTRRKAVVLTSKTSYYLNLKTVLAAVNGNWHFDGGANGGPTIIRAICAYL